MAERKAIGKKLRFEVFKRDSFTCQYCGKSAPDVVLHVDHIDPVKRGGKNDILNLITACIDCNLGKGARELSDNSAVAKQQRQLQEINERREQMELMLKWRGELAKLNDQQISAIVTAFEVSTGHVVNESGKKKARQWLSKYSLAELLEAVELSRNNYLVYEKEGGCTSESVEKAWDYIPRICACRRIEKDNPTLRELNYIKGIVRNRCQYYFNNWMCADLLKKAYKAGVLLEELASMAKVCANWSTWKRDIEDAIAETEETF